MLTDELCRYTRTYSEIEGLQRAHTVSYSAAAVPQGVLLQAEREQVGEVERESVLCPGESPSRLAGALLCLSENSVELAQWLEALSDMGIACRQCEYEAL